MDCRKEINVVVGANIKREREKAGYTQDQLSEMLGIGSKSLSSIERGVVGVSLTTLLKICEILHVSTNVILLERTHKNDMEGICFQLEQLSQDQFDIVSEMIGALLKAFSMNE